MSYRAFSIKERPDLLKSHEKVTEDVYPRFMRHDPIMNDNWGDLFENFPEYQITFLQEKEIVGIADSVPYFWDRPLDSLPDEEWDWALVKGLEDRKTNTNPNILWGLQIAVNRNHRNKGISAGIIRELVNLARQKGFRHLTLPVRPTQKSDYLTVSMEEYIKWANDSGLPFDPWIRQHLKIGGRIIKICHKAMYISGTISEWEQWTGMHFTDSGEYIVPGALTPILIDFERKLGEYIEPNVWIVDDIK